MFDHITIDQYRFAFWFIWKMVVFAVIVGMTIHQIISYVLSKIIHHYLFRVDQAKAEANISRPASRIMTISLPPEIVRSINRIIVDEKSTRSRVILRLLEQSLDNTHKEAGKENGNMD